MKNFFHISHPSHINIGRQINPFSLMWISYEAAMFGAKAEAGVPSVVLKFYRGIDHLGQK